MSERRRIIFGTYDRQWLRKGTAALIAAGFEVNSEKVGYRLLMARKECRPWSQVYRRSTGHTTVCGPEAGMVQALFMQALNSEAQSQSNDVLLTADELEESGVGEYAALAIAAEMHGLDPSDAASFIED